MLHNVTDVSFTDLIPACGYFFYYRIYGINSDDTVIGFYAADGMIYYVSPGYNCLSFSIDVNGTKGPNIAGQDLRPVFNYAVDGSINKHGNPEDLYQ